MVGIGMVGISMVRWRGAGALTGCGCAGGAGALAGCGCPGGVRVRWRGAGALAEYIDKRVFGSKF